MTIKNVKKVKLGKFSMESEKFSEIGGKSETEGNSSLPQGGWTPLGPISCSGGFGKCLSVKFNGIHNSFLLVLLFSKIMSSSQEFGICHFLMSMAFSVVGPCCEMGSLSHSTYSLEFSTPTPSMLT